MTNMTTKNNVDLSSKIKTSIIKLSRDNGDVYLIERNYVYDPILKRNKNISSHIISKIPKGSTKPIPTRSIRKKSPEKSLSQECEINMLDIIDHMGKLSGIDENLYATTDNIKAKQIISIARFMVATNSDSLNNLAFWQREHNLPYSQEISEEVSDSLYKAIGNNLSFKDDFFKERFKKVSGSILRAYTYDLDKDKIFNNEDKLTVVYCINSRQNKILTSYPLAYYSYSSKDTSLLPLFTKIKDITVKQPEYIGKVKNDNLSFLHDFIANKVDFTIETDFTNDQLKHELTHCKFDLKNAKESIAEFDKDLRVYSTHILFHHDLALNEPENERKRTFRRIYVNFYYDKNLKDKTDFAFRNELDAICQKVNEVNSIDVLNSKELALYKKYCTFGYFKPKKKEMAFINEYEYFMACEYHGFRVIISNTHQESKECFDIINSHAKVKDYVFEGQNNLAANVNNEFIKYQHGALFVRFIALAYYEYIKDMLTRIQDALGSPTGDPTYDTPENLNTENELKGWLKDNTNPSSFLQWYDIKRDDQNSATDERFSEENLKKDFIMFNRLGISVLSKARTIH